MANIIALFAFIASLMGLAVIIARKIPTLSRVTVSVRVGKKNLLGKIRVIAKDRNPIKKFPMELFVQKTLSKTRCLVLRIEGKIGDSLANMRRKAIEKKSSFSAEYLEKLKTKQ